MIRQTIDKYKFEISFGVAIMVMLFVVGTTANFKDKETAIYNRIERIESTLSYHDKELESAEDARTKLIDKANANDVKFAEIQAQLKNLEVLILDLKKDLKLHSN